MKGQLNDAATVTTKGGRDAYLPQRRPFAYHRLSQLSSEGSMFPSTHTLLPPSQGTTDETSPACKGLGIRILFELGLNFNMGGL